MRDTRYNMLSRKQANRIIEVIKQDANGRERLRDDDGKMCVVGGLGAAAGMYVPAAKAHLGFETEVCKAYGLADWQLYSLMGTNDAFRDTEARRMALIDRVEQWVKPGFIDRLKGWAKQ